MGTGTPVFNSNKSHPKYPWEKWFANPAFVLRRGKHYKVRSFVMDQQIRNMACSDRFRLSVNIKIADDEQSLTVRVLGKLDDK